MAHFGTARSHVHLSVVMLLVLHTASSLAEISAPGAGQPKPLLVVFDFESKWDSGALGRKAAEMFRGHAKRRRAFTQLDPISFEELLASSGAIVGTESTPADVSALAAKTFSGDVAIWGDLARSENDQYLLHVRIVDRRENPAALALDKTYASSLHGIQTSVDAALDEFLGITRSRKADILADETWRTRKNLCINGSFEVGDGTPDAWEPVDGLGMFWIEDASPTGRCIRIDTNILDSQYRQWRAAFG